MIGVIVNSASISITYVGGRYDVIGCQWRTRRLPNGKFATTKLSLDANKLKNDITKLQSE